MRRLAARAAGCLLCAALAARLLLHHPQLAPPRRATRAAARLGNGSGRSPLHVRCFGDRGHLPARSPLKRDVKWRHSRKVTSSEGRDQAVGDVTYSLITAVRDRTAALVHVLPSWLAVDGLDEAILVDWGSSPPLAKALPAALPALARERRLWLVSAPREAEWNLARAFNLAAAFARGDFLLKVDSDTWLDAAFLARHALRADEAAFFAGDWRRAPDENSAHLNGVALLRRADYAGVGGYDERMRGYGWDDSDLYARLEGEPRRLRRRCVNYSQLSHIAAEHPARGRTWIHEYMHRRAVEAVWRRWHASRMRPSEWEALPGLGTALPPADDADAAAADDDGGLPQRCEVACTRRPPFFEELAAADADGLMAVEWRLAHAAALSRLANGSVPNSVLQRVGEAADYEALLTAYEGMALRGERYLALQPLGALPERLLAVCAAELYARRHGLRLLLVWAEDDGLQASFGELFEQSRNETPAASFSVLRHLDARLFPPRFWHWVEDEPASASASSSSDSSGGGGASAGAGAAAAARARAVRLPPSLHRLEERERLALCGLAGCGAGIFVRSGRPIASVPPLPERLEHAGMRRCLAQHLRPSAPVRALVRRWAASANGSGQPLFGVHYCASPPRAVHDGAPQPRSEALEAEAVAALDAALAEAAPSAPRTNASAAPTAAASAAAVTWSVQCDDEGVVRALHALRRTRPGAAVLLAAQRNDLWPQLWARLARAGIVSRRGAPAAAVEAEAGALELRSLRSAWLRGRCTLPGSRGRTRCAQLELAELTLLSRAATLVRSVGCAGSEVASYLASPATALHTSCGTLATGRRAEAYYAAMHPLSITPSPNLTPPPPPPPTPRQPPKAAVAATTAAAATEAAAAVERPPQAQTMSASAFAQSGLGRKGLQVVLQHSAAVDALLAEDMRQVTLMYVVPSKNTVGSFARKVQAHLHAHSPPKLSAMPADVELPTAMLVAEAHRLHAKGARLQIAASFDPDV